MNEQRFGQVVPFTFSAATLRRSANARRRQGSHVEAIELMRRAAWEGDATAAWLSLAEQLRLQGCWEQAAALLFRLLSRDDAPAEAYLDLGRCLRALGQTELAIDCLYHYLQEDPYAPGADEARLALSEMESPDHVHEPLRLTLLMRRAFAAWQEGRHETAMRRIRRAQRMTRHPERLHITLTLLFMAQEDFSSALKEIARALRRDPVNPRILTTLATLLHQLDKPRFARSVLRRCIPLCADAQGEDMFLTAAWAISARREEEDYLLQRLRRYPNRIQLLHALASLYWETHRRSEAEIVWQRVLRLDPDDRRARVMLKWLPEHPDTPMPLQGSLPYEAAHMQLTVLAKAAVSGMAAEELIRYNTEQRAVLDWCFTIVDESRQSAALSLLLSSEHPQVVRYLKELLMHPALFPEVRRQVLVRLAELGESGPMQMLMGPRITQVMCQPMQAKHRVLWRIFLPALLHESRFWRQSPEIVSFAADLWPLLTRTQREAAAGNDILCWAKAIEIVYLRITGQEEAACCAADKSPVSLRHVSRIIRLIAAKMEAMPEVFGVAEGESEDEVH